MVSVGGCTTCTSIGLANLINTNAVIATKGTSTRSKDIRFHAHEEGDDADDDDDGDDDDDNVEAAMVGFYNTYISRMASC